MNALQARKIRRIMMPRNTEHSYMMFAIEIDWHEYLITNQVPPNEKGRYDESMAKDTEGNSR